MGNLSSSVSPSIEQYDDGSIDESNGDMLNEDPHQEVDHPAGILEVNTKTRLNNYYIYTYIFTQSTETQLPNCDIPAIASEVITPIY